MPSDTCRVGERRGHEEEDEEEEEEDDDDEDDVLPRVPRDGTLPRSIRSHSRPGVATRRWQPRSSALICCRISAPP